MKKITCFILVSFLFVCFSTVKAQMQVPNGGFENWTDTVTCQSWSGKLSYAFGLVNHYFLTQTSDSHTGNYAAKIETKSDLALGNIPGLATLGEIKFDLLGSGLTIEGGKPINSKPIKFKGFYKYDNVQGDTMMVIIFMYKWNTNLNKRDTIAVGQFVNKNTVTTYTPFNININYTPSTATPDSFNIIFVASAGYTPQLGTAMYVDALEFEYNNAGLEDVASNVLIDIFPNPASSYVHVNINTHEAGRVQIMNLAGQELYLNEFAYAQEIIDITSFADGVYFVNVQTATQNTTRKIIVTR